MVDDEAESSGLGHALPPNVADARVEPGDSRARVSERELEMAKCPGRDELRRTASGLRNELERAQRRGSGLVRSAALSGDEALEREVVRDEGVLSGLLGDLLPLACSSKSALEPAECALDLTE